MDVASARVHRVRWCVATWVVVACLVSTVAAHAQTGNPPPKGSPLPEGTPLPAGAEAQENPAGPDGDAVPQVTATPSRCAEYVDVLSGKKKDDALLKDPKVKAVAAQSLDLLLCLAVARDSDDPCALMPKDAPQHGQECRQTRAVFHELRTNPQGRSFMFPDSKYQACRTHPEIASICDRWRTAARSGDPNECTGMGEMETECRAELTLNDSLCAKTQEPEGCKKAIEANRVYAKGLKSVAESGPPRDRILAKAALGEQDACAPFVEAALGFCASPPSLGTPAVATTTRPAPSREAPAPRKSPASR